MAPLRTSRATRNQDHQVAARSRGVVDLDPTEGLPVQKWEQVSVRVNQDPSADPSAAPNNNPAATATSSVEWAAQFNTEQFPWPEKPLPSFFSQLPTWNQEMLRRARAGNTNAKLSVWDRKGGSWISAAEAEKRNNPLKSVHLNNLDHSSTNNNTATDDAAEHDDDEDNEDAADDDMEVDNEDDTVGLNRGTQGLKRRKHTAPEDRAFFVKRWVQVPLAVAEKTEERKFLAERRPGMPSLYGGAYQNEVFGPLGLTQNGYNAYGTSNAAYDLGDGAGLGNAIGSNQADQGTSTPVRRNMPPKRKKKKGGPGRRKADTNTTGDAMAGSQTNTGSYNANGQDPHDATNSNGNNEQKDHDDVTMRDNDGSGSSESEGEGSEEGEIEERPQNESQADQNQEAAPEKSGIASPQLQSGTTSLQAHDPDQMQSAPSESITMATDSVMQGDSDDIAKATLNASNDQTAVLAAPMEQKNTTLLTTTPPAIDIATTVVTEPAPAASAAPVAVTELGDTVIANQSLSTPTSEIPATTIVVEEQELPAASVLPPTEVIQSLAADDVSSLARTAVAEPMTTAMSTEAPPAIEIPIPIEEPDQHIISDTTTAITTTVSDPAVETSESVPVPLPESESTEPGTASAPVPVPALLTSAHVATTDPIPATPAQGTGEGAAAAAVVASESELDLLGGLEDQLDRDMQE